jgi:GT2 family glycosyltransferase
MDVSIIIVNYNTPDLTKSCIESIYQYSLSSKFEVILIDNGSQISLDPTIFNSYPNFTFIWNSYNYGFGYANNQGIQIAKGEFVFLLNSDTKLCSDALSECLSYMRNPNNLQVAVCGAELFTGTSISTPSFGNFPSIFGSIAALGFRFLIPKYYNRHLAIGVVNYDDQIKRVDLVSGADMFIRKSVLEKVGLFDEAFFLYFEETELSYRISRAGYYSVILPFIKIQHFEGSSSNNMGSDFNYVKFGHYVKSRNLFYKKAYGITSTYVFLPFDITYTLLKTITKREGGNLFKKIKLILNA